MSTWMPDIVLSHRLQLAVTAVVAAGLSVSVVLGLQRARREYNVYDLKKSIPEVESKHDVGKAGSTSVPRRRLALISIPSD